MSLHQLFLEEQVLAQETESVFPLRLTPEDAKHVRVLRIAPGEHIAVVDGAGDYFECRVEDTADGLTVRICRREDAPVRPQVMLVQGLAKGDKMDTVIRQGTELGVAAFVPLACERSVVKLDGAKEEKRARRWRAIAKSAAMQSGQPAIPEISPLRTVDEACALLAEATAVAICWEEAPLDVRMGDVIRKGREACGAAHPFDVRLAVVVGPEGGLASSEADQLLDCNPRASLVSLGSSILRTETAGVVAAALALYELGCL